MNLKLELKRSKIKFMISLSCLTFFISLRDQDILNILVQEGEILEIDPISGTCEMRFRLEKVISNSVDKIDKHFEINN